MRLLFLWLPLVPLLIGQTNPFAGDAAAIDLGKGNFRLYCAPCHGIHAEGGRGPDLTRGIFSAGETDADLHRVISKGVNGTEMEGYEGHLDEQMIWRFVAFIRSSAKAVPVSATGDVQHGSEVFWGKGGCGGCHAVGVKGGGVGPALTRVGRERSLEYLREKLVDPDKSIAPGYSTLTVKLKDGKTVRGVEKGFDDFSAQLLDVNRRFYSFNRDQVASVRREDHSLMPGDYGKRLSSAEQTDVLAYVASLRGEK